MLEFPKVRTRSRTLFEVSLANGRVVPVSYEMMAAEDVIVVFRNQSMALGSSTNSDFDAALDAIRAAFAQKVSVTVA